MTQKCLNPECCIKPRDGGPCPACPTATPETDAMVSMRRTITEWKEHSEKLERERDEARDQLYRIDREVFGMEDTIGGESCVDYVLRRLGKSQKTTQTNEIPTPALRGIKPSGDS